MKRLTIVLASFAILAGCGGQKPAEQADKGKEAEKADAPNKDEGEDKAVMAKDGSDATLSSEAPITDAEHIEAEPAEPLTEEELALIEKDPKDLTVEERRKRGYALRKRIMQDPDSPQAQSILRGAKAIEDGEMEVPAEFKTPVAETPTEAAPEK